MTATQTTSKPSNRGVKPIKQILDPTGKPVSAREALVAAAEAAAVVEAEELDADTPDDVEEPTPSKRGRKSDGPPKSTSIKLVDPGSTEEILILGYLVPSGPDKGKWRVEATKFEGKYVKGERRDGVRGASSFVANLAEARKATEKLAAGLVKRGWVRPEVKPIGMERKEDAFDLNSLPAPSSRKK